MYKSNFKPSQQAQTLLSEGKILGPNESPSKMVERVVNEVVKIELKFNPSKQENGFANRIGNLIDQKKIIPSTPILTNAGRYKNRTLSACVVPPVEIKGDLEKISGRIHDAHKNGMGTGFCFDEVENPVKALNYLNKIAIEGAKSGSENRPVGNMATISVRHHKIEEFIFSKDGLERKGQDWKFNISISIDEYFMQSLKNGGLITLTNGETRPATNIFDMIVEASHSCADPGILFIDKLNEDNPTPTLGTYKTVAPCGEVGLTEGEFCQFAYINLAKFYCRAKQYLIDLEELKKTIWDITRFLDDALEISIDRTKSSKSKHVMTHKRKIGIGVCGFADLLSRMKLPYDSKKARTVAEDIMSFINYHSKLASVNLAETRGSFLALEKFGLSKYDDDPGYLEKKYSKHSTRLVNRHMWNKLSKDIRKNRSLRNATTTALPPTGRSAQIIDASAGIEPYFSLCNYSGNLNKNLIADLKNSGQLTNNIILIITRSGKIKNIKSISTKIRNMYKTALEIHYKNHLLMAAAFQKHVDESISKTINLPSNTTKEEVKNAFMLAHKLNLKGVTVYRAGCKRIEPRKLAL